jgi:hypothetical protein
MMKERGEKCAAVRGTISNGGKRNIITDIRFPGIARSSFRQRYVAEEIRRS